MSDQAKYAAYRRKFKAENYDTISITVKKGLKDDIKDYALTQGKSLNGYINDLIKKDMGLI